MELENANRILLGSLWELATYSRCSCQLPGLKHAPNPTTTKCQEGIGSALPRLWIGHSRPFVAFASYALINFSTACLSSSYGSSRLLPELLRKFGSTCGSPGSSPSSVAPPAWHSVVQEASTSLKSCVPADAMSWQRRVSHVYCTKVKACFSCNFVAPVAKDCMALRV